MHAPTLLSLTSLLLLTPFGAAHTHRKAPKHHLHAARSLCSTSSNSSLHCLLATESFEGPFYIDQPLIRSNITEDRDGIPFILNIKVVDVRFCTAPEEPVYVDIWHADVDGEYSGWATQAEVEGDDGFAVDVARVNELWVQQNNYGKRSHKHKRGEQDDFDTYQGAHPHENDHKGENEHFHRYKVDGDHHESKHNDEHHRDGDDKEPHHKEGDDEDHHHKEGDDEDRHHKEGDDEDHHHKDDEDHHGPPNRGPPGRGPPGHGPPGRGGPGGPRGPFESSRWLRGVQATPSNGTVTFNTVWPGWYNGRTTHIHVRIHAGNATVSAENGTLLSAGRLAHTGQVFFADELVQKVRETREPYKSRKGNEPLKNEDDGQFVNSDGADQVVEVKELEDGSFVGHVTVGIDPTARHNDDSFGPPGRGGRGKNDEDDEHHHGKTEGEDGEHGRKEGEKGEKDHEKGEKDHEKGEKDGEKDHEKDGEKDDDEDRAHHHHHHHHHHDGLTKRLSIAAIVLSSIVAAASLLAVVALWRRARNGGSIQLQ